MITLFAQVIQQLPKEFIKSLVKKAWYGQTRQPESLGIIRAPSKSNLPYQNATRSC